MMGEKLQLVFLLLSLYYSNINTQHVCDSDINIKHNVSYTEKGADCILEMYANTSMFESLEKDARLIATVIDSLELTKTSLIIYDRHNCKYEF